MDLLYVTIFTLAGVIGGALYVAPLFCSTKSHKEGETQTEEPETVSRDTYDGLLSKHEQILEKYENCRDKNERLEKNMKQTISEKRRAILGFEERHKEIQKNLNAKEDEIMTVRMEVVKLTRNMKDKDKELAEKNALIAELRARIASAQATQPRPSTIFSSSPYDIYNPYVGTTINDTTFSMSNPHMRFRLDD